MICPLPLTLRAVCDSQQACVARQNDTNSDALPLKSIIKIDLKIYQIILTIY
jgi:hypothetical protein